MDPYKSWDIRRKAAKYLGWEEIVPNFYERLEEELMANGYTIDKIGYENEEVYKVDPDPEKLEFDIYVTDSDEQEFGIDWEPLTPLKGALSKGYQAGGNFIATTTYREEDGEEREWENETTSDIKGDIDAHIRHLPTLLRSSRNFL